MQASSLSIRFIFKPVVLSIQIALSSAILLTATATHAATPSSIQYMIGAGDLAQALNQFAVQSGVAISTEIHQLEGLKTHGLNGQYTVDQGFTQLLQDTGYQAQHTQEGYVLIKKNTVPSQSRDMGQLKTIDINANGYRSRVSGANDAVQLPAITITAENDATSEGTGSYTGKSTVGKLALDLREIPQSVSIISRQQMDDRNANTVEEVMKYATGITSYGNDGFSRNTPGFYARGNSELQVQYDGIKSGSGSQFDTAIYDRIEVQRGPAGLVNGSGSPAGTVNLVRKRGLSEFTTQGSLSIGSWNQYRGHVDVTGPLNNDASLRGRAIFATEDREFFYDNADASKVTGYVNLDYDLTPTTLAGLAFTISKESSTPYNGRIGYTDGTFPNWSRSIKTDANYGSSDYFNWEIVGDIEHKINENWKIKTGIRYREGEDKYIGARHFAIDKISGLVDRYQEYAVLLNGEMFSADINISGTFDLWNQKHDVLFGYNYDLQKSDNRTAGNGNWSNLTGTLGQYIFDPLNMPYDPNRYTLDDIRYQTASETKQSGLYGMIRLKLLDPLTIVLGGRLSDYDNKSQAILPTAGGWTQGAHESSEFNPYAGVLWDFSKDLTWYVSYADVFIPQTTKDWQERTLDPRIGWQIETGVKGAFFDGTLNTTVALFRIRDKNRAINDLDHMCGTSYCSIEGGLLQNQGWEIDLSGSPIAGLELTAGYTRTDTKYLKDNNAARVGINQTATTYNPKHIYKAWANYRFNEHFQDSWLTNLNLGGGLLGSGNIGTKTEGTIYQGGYTVFSLAAGYKINENLHASLNINNIFDKTYFRQINHQNGFNYFGDPRNFMLTLRAKY